jgi:UDP-glucuronate decarboxylase
VNRILVTGSSGQIGARLSKILATEGLEVIGIGKRKVAQNKNPDFIYIELDLLQGNIEKIVRKYQPRTLVHLAWETQPQLFWSSPRNYDWLESSKKLIESFVRWGGEEIIVAGTCAEYDWQRPAPYEETSRELPNSIYGQTKLELLNFLRHKKLPFLWVRIFFQFGGLEHSGRIIPAIIDSFYRNSEFLIKRPDDVRDFIHVDDVAQIMARLIISKQKGLFNVASGNPIKILELGRVIASLMNCHDLLKFQSQDDGVSVVHGDTAKLKLILNQFECMTLIEGIKKTILERKLCDE